MVITAKIHPEWTTKNGVSFYDDSGSIGAVVRTGGNSYELNPASGRKLDIYSSQLLINKLIITDKKTNLKWMYKPRKWYQAMMDMRCLFTDRGDFDLFIDHSAKLEAYLGDRKIGTVRWEDPEAIRASFADDIDTLIVLVIISILYIQIENWNRD